MTVTLEQIQRDLADIKKELAEIKQLIRSHSEVVTEGIKKLEEPKAGPQEDVDFEGEVGKEFV